MLKRELGGRVGWTILKTWAKKAGLLTVPYPREIPITSSQDLMSKAYKQF